MVDWPVAGREDSQSGTVGARLGMGGAGRGAWLGMAAGLGCPDHVTPTLKIFFFGQVPSRAKVAPKWALDYGGKSPKPKARTTPIVKATFSKISVRLNAFLIRHDPSRVGEYV